MCGTHDSVSLNRRYDEATTCITSIAIYGVAKWGTKSLNSNSITNVTDVKDYQSRVFTKNGLIMVKPKNPFLLIHLASEEPIVLLLMIVLS